MINAIQRLTQKKDLQALEVLDSRGRTIYEITVRNDYGRRLLSIRRSLADQINDNIMVDMPFSQFSRSKKPREITPKQLLDAGTIEDVAKNYPGFPERYKRTANYLGDLKACAIFLLPSESLYIPQYFFQNLQEINKFNEKTDAPALSLREMTSNLDLSRIREIKPMAPEGQLSASRL